MQTPASIAGHPLHMTLSAFPIGLLAFSLICDLAALVALDPVPWQLVALTTMVGGFIGALAAAIPGAVDLFWLSNLKLKQIGMWHMSLNLLVDILYGVNIWLRYAHDDAGGAPFALSVLSVAILSVSSWLGAELVHKHGVGVAGADPPAPAARRAPPPET
jgi:uncharacterized membrane protein